MTNLSPRMYELGSKRSEIRELFEYGKKRAAEMGADKVFDFSIGNPSVPSPACVNETLQQLIAERPSVALHGYTSAQGDAGVRRACAEYIQKTHGTACSADDFYMTCGAAASLTISLLALSCPGDEAIVLAPYFPEYKVFAEEAGMKCVEVLCRESDFRIDFDAMKAAINEHTKAVIVNSPNNPTGVVYSEEELRELGAMLCEAEEKYGHSIFLLADEPYRELVYDAETKVPFIPNLYHNTLVCYSFSKSVSLPGERIGYVMVPPSVDDHDRVYAAVCGAGRAQGYVCAPALFQYMVPACLGKTSDLSVYRANRDRLCEALTEMGFTCVRPQGAFYLFMKAAEADARAFSMKAREYGLLLVASDSFGCPGFVRIAYCVAPEMIERALPAFRALAKDYGLC